MALTPVEFLLCIIMNAVSLVVTFLKHFTPVEWSESPCELQYYSVAFKNNGVSFMVFAI